MQFLALAAMGALAIAGCEDKKSPPAGKNIDIQAGPVDVKVDEGGVKVDTPSADVDVERTPSEKDN